MRDITYRLLELVPPMFDGRDENAIVRLAGEAVGLVGSCRVESHVQDGGRWYRAFPVRHAGFLIVSAPAEPSRQELDLLTMIAEQTTLALVNASARSGIERLHRGLYAAFASGAGEPGIVEVLHRTTGLPAAVEDLFGNLRAWAGPDRPDPYPKANPRRRRELLREVTRHGPVARVRDQLIAVAGKDMKSVLVLMDPGRTAGQHELLALEHSAMVLTGELAHQYDMIEMERRLRRDLVADLLSGHGGDNVYERARAVDHDLHGPHHVVAVQWAGGANGVLTSAAEHAAAGLGISALASTKNDATILLARNHVDGTALHDAIAKRLRTPDGAVGVGGACDSPAEFSRSFREALLALEVRTTSSTPHGATSFEELGVMRVLDTGDGGAKIRRFVRDWLGRLLDYDESHGSDLVRTLSRHLECGGNYDDTAAALVIHRSTLRYRLQRIREISGLDLTDVGNRLNLHVATRAWRITRPGR